MLILRLPPQDGFASYKGVYGTIFEGEKVRFEVLLLAVIIVNIANPSGIQNA